jgi:hypothetical protein
MTYKETFWDTGWGILTMTVVLLTVVMTAIIWVVIVLEGEQCARRAQGLNRNHEWTLIGGCLIESDDGRLVPLDNYFENRPVD